MNHVLKVFCIMVLFLPAAAFAVHTHVTLLNGHQETPPVATGGEGCGTFNLVGDDLYYDMWWAGLSSAVNNGHIHIGPVGTPGGVVHPLQNLSQTGAYGVWMDLTAAQIGSLNSHGLYVNVHTDDYPAGEIRGQILLNGTYTSVLDGAQETPPVATPGIGFGWYRLNAAQDTLSYGIAWGNLLPPQDVTNGHIHLNVAGQSGGVVHPLQNLTELTSFGNWPLSAQNIVQLNAESLYVNIHTTNWGAGEIRGQILQVCVGEVASFDASTDVGESRCISLCWQEDACHSRIRIVNVPPGLYPAFSVAYGCNPAVTGCDDDCIAATYYELQPWTDENGIFDILIMGSGCVCVTLDGILAVNLLDFTALAGNNQVTLNWNTASEINNDYFEIQRDGETVTQVDATNSATGARYSWVDYNVTNGQTYAYTLVSVAIDGAREELRTLTATPSATSATITDYALHQNYPNPFNPETNIVFDLPEESFATVKIFNAIGQEVLTLVSTELSAGRHTIAFSATSLPSGIYFYRLDAGSFSAQRKMLLIK